MERYPGSQKEGIPKSHLKTNLTFIGREKTRRVAASAHARNRKKLTEGRIYTEFLGGKRGTFQGEAFQGGDWWDSSSVLGQGPAARADRVFCEWNWQLNVLGGVWPLMCLQGFTKLRKGVTAHGSSSWLEQSKRYTTELQFELAVTFGFLLFIPWKHLQ